MKTSFDNKFANINIIVEDKYIFAVFSVNIELDLYCEYIKVVKYRYFIIKFDNNLNFLVFEKVYYLILFIIFVKFVIVFIVNFDEKVWIFLFKFDRS